jgi:hypothetical protein
MHTLDPTNQEFQMLALVKLLPESMRLKAFFYIGISTMPMMRYVRPKLIEYTTERVVVRIDVSHRSKNGLTPCSWAHLQLEVTVSQGRSQ